MVERFNAISAEMGDPKDDTDFDALMEEMGELQEKIDAVDGWTLDNQLEIAMDALRCPPGDASVDNLSGGENAASRYASCCCTRSPRDWIYSSTATGYTSDFGRRRPVRRIRLVVPQSPHAPPSLLGQN